MKTSLRVWERGDKQITLLGAIHIGSEEYYKNLQQILDNFNDGTVLYEGVKNENKDFGLLELYNSFAQFLGLKMQKCMEYREHWENVDLSLEEVHFLNNNKIKDSLQEALEAVEKIVKLKEDGYDFSKFILFFIKMNMLFKNFKKDNEGLSTFRNYYVLLEAFRLLMNENKTLIFYGEGHIRGMEKSLKNLGFKLIEKRKIKAF